MAYRNLQQWQKSLQLWQLAVSKAPQNTDYRRGQILTTADAGQFDIALNKLEQLQREAPDKTNTLVAAYIYKLAGRHRG